MAGVVRLGDICSGHAGFNPRANISASSNVFVNSIQVHRQGDSWPLHTDGNTQHPGNTVGGSSTVFVNGVPVARTGDAISCGSTCQGSSNNVNAG